MTGPVEPGSFGELVRRHRLDARLTQARLAELAGISLRAVQDLERSVGQPQRETARRLAEALALTGDRRAQFDHASAPAPRSRAATRRPPSHRIHPLDGPPGDPPGGPGNLAGE